MRTNLVLKKGKLNLTVAKESGDVVCLIRNDDDALSVVHRLLKSMNVGVQVVDERCDHPSGERCGCNCHKHGTDHECMHCSMLCKPCEKCGIIIRKLCK